MKLLALASLSTLALSGITSAGDELAPPIRIAVNGSPIDVGKCVGHAGPNLLDIDGDGRLELVVGDFVGHVHVHPNTGTREAPIFGEGRTLEADGEAIRISNW